MVLDSIDIFVIQNINVKGTINSKRMIASKYDRGF